MRGGGGGGGWKGRGVLAHSVPGLAKVAAAAAAGLGGVGLALCLLSAAPGPGASLHRVILYQTGRLQKVDGRWRREGLVFFLKVF